MGGTSVVKIVTDYLKLSEVRIRKGMKIIDLAAKAGVSKESIYSIEKGRHNPSPAIANKLAEVLSVPYDDIFSIVEGE